MNPVTWTHAYGAIIPVPEDIVVPKPGVAEPEEGPTAWMVMLAKESPKAPFEMPDKLECPHPFYDDWVSDGDIPEEVTTTLLGSWAGRDPTREELEALTPEEYRDDYEPPTA